MTITQEFNYVRPKNIKEALTHLWEHKSPVILAGGTDLARSLKDGTVSPGAIIDIKGLEPLAKILYKEKSQKLEIGALVTFAQLIESPVIRRRFPLIVEMARTVGTAAIRSRATMAGNICSAVPCMDSAPILNVYDAEVKMVAACGSHRLPIFKWFKGPRKTAARPAEILTAIALPLPAPEHGGCFIKLTRNRAGDMAQASVAVLALPDHRYRVSFGAVAPVPFRARKIEKLLDGSPLSEALVKEARRLIPLEIQPIDDIRASKEHRLHLCGVMLERALRAAADRLNGAGPAYGTVFI
jgi:carbon-monoxide dehydrogenase medium subunit